MPVWSRRRALQAAPTLLLPGLAGCNEGRNHPRPRDDRTPVEDIEVLRVRNTDPEPMVIDSRQSARGTATTTEPPRRRGGLMLHLTDTPSESGRDLHFPEAVPGADALRRFLVAANYDTGSVYLFQSSIPECYRRHLRGVYRDDSGVDADFCRELRSADVACEADAFAMNAFAIRLPFSGDEFNSVGGGSSSSCRRPPGHGEGVIEPDTDLIVGPGEDADQ